MTSSNNGLTLATRIIHHWTVPTVEFSNSALSLHLSILGAIINSIVDGQRGRDRQHNWKLQITSEVKATRGNQPWNPRDTFAITLGMSFHPGNHGNRSLDTENFIKPVLDGLTAGLFCENDMDPLGIKRFDYDDSNFNTLLIHRLDDAPTNDLEGVAISVSARTGG